VVGGRGGGNPRPRGGRQGEATRRLCGAWWPPRVPREQADHDPPARTAGGTPGTRAAGRAPGIGRRRHGCGRGGRGLGGVPRQAALALVPAGTTDRTPQPIVADVGAPLGPHLLANATPARMRRPGHGRPALVVGVLVAAGAVVRRDGASAVGGPRDPVDLPAQVLPDRLGAWPGGCAGDDPPLVQTDSGIRRSGRAGCTSARNRPRQRCERAWTGTTEDGRAGRHAVRSAETPPAGTRPCTGGWEATGRVQVCRTHHPPLSPPTSWGSAARVMRAGAAARRRLSSSACG